MAPSLLSPRTLHLDSGGRRGVGRTLSLVADSIRTALANHLLPTLLLGVAIIALILAVLGADTSIVLGVLGIGCATAFIESSSRRSGKR